MSARIAKKTYEDNLTDPNDEVIHSFPVIVETEIGHVTIGPNGKEHPFVAAMKIIAEHHVKQDYQPATYRFDGEGENETVRVAITSESN